MRARLLGSPHPAPAAGPPARTARIAAAFVAGAFVFLSLAPALHGAPFWSAVSPRIPAVSPHGVLAASGPVTPAHDADTCPFCHAAAQARTVLSPDGAPAPVGRGLVIRLADRAVAGRVARTRHRPADPRAPPVGPRTVLA
jgi:hypothetical protein